MGLKKVLKKIEQIAPKDLAADNLSDMMMYALEEFGEVSECITTQKGFKNKNIKEDVTWECVDVIIAMLGVYFVAGGKSENLAGMIDTKSEKWKKRVEKYHVRNSRNSEL